MNIRAVTSRANGTFFEVRDYYAMNSNDIASNKTPLKTPLTAEPLLRTIWWITLFGLGGMLALPFRFGLLRLALILTGVLLWFGAAYLCRRQRAVVALSFIAPVILVGILLAPGRPVDSEQLRSTYIESLASLEGTYYVWGGETRLGIDCSGLVRGAFIDANLRVGVRTANPALLRTAANMWWHDCSAKALGENYRGWTRTLAETKTLNDADYVQLLPGDIAVTAGGSHILAYLGNRIWIQADPLPMHVVKTTIPSKEGWFVQKAQLLRWTELDTPASVQTASVRRRTQLPR